MKNNEAKHIYKNITEILKMITDASKFRIPLVLFKSVLDAFPTLINIFIMKSVLDIGSKGSNLMSLLGVIGISAFLYITIALYNAWFNQKFKVHSDLCIKEHLQSVVYSKIPQIDLEAYDSTEFYTSYTKAVKEINNRAISVLETLSTILSNFISLIGVASIILYLQSELILFVIMYVVLSTFIASRKTKVVYQADMAQIDDNRKMDYVSRIFYLKDYIKDLKVFNFYTYFINCFKEVIKNLHIIKKDFENKFLFYDFIQNILQVVFVLAMITFLGIKLFFKQITVGSFAGLLNSAQSLGNAIQQTFTFFPDMIQHSMYIDNIKELLDYKSKIETTTHGKKTDRNKHVHVIELQNVSYRYTDTSNNVINNVNLTIKSGGTVAIVGYNGAGKTTLIKNIVRLYDPTNGKISMDGTNYKEYEISALRSMFGIVFQDFQCFATSIADNILLRKLETPEDEKLVWDALHISGLAEKVKSLPKGIQSVLTKEFDEDGVILSGGEIQKLAIARVFAQNYPIIILDEPTSALDPISEFELFNRIKEISKEKILIIISHRLYAIRNMDKIIYFEKGEIKECGNHESLIKKNRRYAEMYYTQCD